MNHQSALIISTANWIENSTIIKKGTESCGLNVPTDVHKAICKKAYHVLNVLYR